MLSAASCLHDSRCAVVGLSSCSATRRGLLQGSSQEVSKGSGPRALELKSFKASGSGPSVISPVDNFGRLEKRIVIPTIETRYLNRIRASVECPRIFSYTPQEAILFEAGVS